MRTALQLVVLTSFVALALGSYISDLQMSLMCCDYTITLPLVYTDPIVPAGSVPAQRTQNRTSIHLIYSVFAVPAPVATDDEREKRCTFETTLNKHGLLSDNKTSIKEEEFKRRFIESAHPDAKNVMKVALDACFEKLKEGSFQHKICESGVEGLVKCIVNIIAADCPKTIWYTTRKACTETKNEGEMYTFNH